MISLHKILGTVPGNGMQPKEVISYSIAGFGQNLICALITSFLLVFYTDAVGIAAASVAWLMLGARLFDAFNDPLMGSIVDKTRTKWGKLRPYLLFMPIPIAIMTVVCFTTLPNAGQTPKFIWATITYVIWSVCYTIVDVPYWGLSSAMTADSQKRSTMLTVARLFCTAGAGLVTIIIPVIQGAVEKRATGGIPLKEVVDPILREAVARDLQTAFLWIAIVVVILATPTFFIGFKGTKERYYSAEKPKSLWHNLTIVAKNKPLMLIVLSGILGALKLIYLTSGIYFAKYNLGNVGLFTFITMLVIPGGLIASILTPMLVKKFGKKNLYIYSHLAGAVVMFAMFFVGWKTNGGLIFSAVGLILLGIPSGFSNILTYAMIADSIDYLEWKTGERAEGICFSMQTFISKIGMAFSAFAIMITLAIVNFDEYSNMKPSEEVQNGIWFTSVFLAGLSMLLTAIPLFFYKFDEKEQRRVVAITAERKGIELESSEYNPDAL